jgi:hypothetical protein
MAKITVRAATFKKLFPKSMPVPPRLLAFAEWLRRVDHGTLGYFDVLAGERLDENYVRNPERTSILAEKLGIFLFLPDGSYLALWDFGGREPAVVLIGSEGELWNVAPTFDAFLFALAQAKTGVNALDDEDASTSRPALRAWLKQQGVAPAKKKGKVPDFEPWFLGEEDAGATERVVPMAGFEMKAFTPTLYRLLGKNSEDAELRSFLAALGLWPLPRKKRDDFALYLEKKRQGFCLLFDEAPKVAGQKGQLLILNACFFYSQGKDGYRGFAHAMPCRIRWADTMKSLASRLGPATHEYKDKETGFIHGQRWEGKGREYLGGKAYVAVGYTRAGRLDDVFLGIL